MIFSKEKCAVCKKEKFFVHPRRFTLIEPVTDPDTEKVAYVKTSSVSQNPMCRKCAKGFRRIMKGK